MKKPSEAAGQPVQSGAIVLAPEAGRSYDLGGMRAVFKADGVETDDRYSISEWWLEPRTTGPGAHRHEANDEIFYVIEGRPSLLIGEDGLPRRAAHSSAFPQARCTTSRIVPGNGPAC